MTSRRGTWIEENINIVCIVIFDLWSTQEKIKLGLRDLTEFDPPNLNRLPKYLGLVGELIPTT